MGLDNFHKINDTMDKRLKQYILMADGANFLIKNKMINQDVKTDNMMINKEGDLKFIDLGMLSSLEEAASFAGSPYYFSPAKSVLT